MLCQCQLTLITQLQPNILPLNGLDKSAAISHYGALRAEIAGLSLKGKGGAGRSFPAWPKVIKMFSFHTRAQMCTLRQTLSLDLEFCFICFIKEDRFMLENMHDLRNVSNVWVDKETEAFSWRVVVSLLSLQAARSPNSLPSSTHRPIGSSFCCSAPGFRQRSWHGSRGRD